MISIICAVEVDKEKYFLYELKFNQNNPERSLCRIYPYGENRLIAVYRSYAAAYKALPELAKRKYLISKIEQIKTRCRI